ncbi:multicopper oxidase domain-containing protein [Halegenticoccus soli]|uniref:multicopper oxidase domain-containing protein n=1 Tax=Halegenticoccus soli TaxID=1985678 RepID=UPI000C6E86A0|nr:multicopper oxidase domain-containing protein [Halegenticoccus soli]
MSSEDKPQPTGEPSRRDVLKGGGALGAGALLANAGINPNEPFTEHGEVPDEPDEGGRVRHFTVHAIEVDLVFNRYGLHQPNAAVYVLEENLDEARAASGVVPCGNRLVDDGPFCDDRPKRRDDHEHANDEAHHHDGRHDHGGDDHEHDHKHDHDHPSVDEVCRLDNGLKRDDDVDTRVLQPLVLRANQGDVFEIEFVNHLDRHASIHQTSLPYEVEESDGMDVGFNPDTTAAPGETVTYRWFADELGTHFFLDGANQAVDSADEPPQVANLLSRGLFGSACVYPQGTTTTDPFTGEPDPSGVQADVHVPEDLTEQATLEGFVPGVDYREVLIHYHTPEGIVTAEGDQLTFPESDVPQTVHAINYRADPTGNRIDPDRCPACDSSEFYSSWIHGDPGGGDNVYPAYLGDPIKVTAIGASFEENHVHHLHGHRWKKEPTNRNSDTVDSQTVGLGAVYEAPFVAAFGSPRGGIQDFQTVRPNMTFEEAFQVGAGGAHGSAGDYLFHCHLFPHYGEGMWGMMRVFDKERKGLKKLRTNEPPIPADSDIPGFPEFIPGEFELGPPFPPYGAAGLEGFRDPTPEEEAALTRKGPILPGAPYTDPCDPDIDVPGFDTPDVEIEGEKREYTIVALRADVVYNDAGHHDPEGRVFVLEEDAEAVRCGDMNPEPLVIRANVGDCVEITLKNEIEEDVIPVPTVGGPDQSGGKSNHIHFVSYDVLGSDSLATGFNYNQQSLPDQPITFRWFPDEEGTIFFHDHITGVENVMNGTFCSLIVEPPNSEWLDPHTGEPIRSGTQAIISQPEGEDFREFALAYHDFAQLVDRDGEFVNPDEEHNENAGVMAINYRNTPMYIREGADPAYVHSSFVHGDPSTPILEAYENDPVRFRVWQGAYEEQHNFHLHGRRFDPEGLDPEEAVTQVIGTSEAFTFDIQPEHAAFEQPPGEQPLNENPAGLPIRDYMYGSTIIDDLWDGMWGIYRVYGARVDHLKPLPDRGAPDGRIPKKKLREAGVSTAFLDLEKKGHKAKLLYDEDDNRAFPPDKDARQNENIPGSPPPRAPSPGQPCPQEAPDRVFDVTAFQTTIEYNEYGDQDQFGIVFAMDDHVEDIKAGRRELTPLTLWVNEGDCIEINLTNGLDPDELDDDHAHPQMRTKEENLGIEPERSNRISLHATRIGYNVLGSDGTTVGFNWDQTIPPGETITYRYLADEPIGTVTMWDEADIRNNRHHGAYGRLLVQEDGVEFVDGSTGEPIVQGLEEACMIKNPDGADRREFALAFADAQFILNADDPDDCVVPPGFDEDEVDPDAPCNQIPDDPEDQGYVGINYRAEPFIRRFENDPDQWQVYSSEIHGDPATPVLNALLDDPVTFHVHKLADKARGLSFHLAAHQWPRTRLVPQSEEVGVDDQFTVGRGDQIIPRGGAGGLADSTGDHIYQELKQRRRLEAGFWGIFRVHERPDEFPEPVQPLPEKAGKMPLRDRPGWNVAYGDVTGDGTRDVLIGVPDSDIAGTNAGAAYLFKGPNRGPITDLLDADVQILGASYGDRTGTGVRIETRDDGRKHAVIETESRTHCLCKEDLSRKVIHLSEMD